MLKLPKINERRVRFLNFITELDGAATKDISELNKFIESALKDDSFIGEACLPLLKGGKRLRPLLFFICAKPNGNFSLEKMLPLAAAIELIHTKLVTVDPNILIDIMW